MRSSWFQVASIFVLLFAISVTLPGFAQDDGISIGDTVQVTTSGSNLNLRQEPGLEQPIVAKLPPGSVLKVIAGPKNRDGHIWWKLEGPQGSGWSAAEYLRPVTGEVSPSSPKNLSQVPASELCDAVNWAYEGVGHCVRDGGETQVIIIDLDDPHVRFETVIANDAQSVNTNERELIPSMTLRYPGTAAAINADYTGRGHGPEGLTIKNGIRYDGIDNMDDDYGAVNRSALAISKSILDGGESSINAEVIRLKDDRQVLDYDRYFNAVGGGPQVVYNGSWEWTTGYGHKLNNGCITELPEDTINGECFVSAGYWDGDDIRWTAVGITGDGHLIWVITDYRNIKTTFQAFEVTEAIKLDGGGSSQMWFDGKTIVESSDTSPRAVADGLLVFYMLSAEILEKPNWPVAIENEGLDVTLTLRNTGADIWRKDEYVLRKVNEYAVVPRANLVAKGEEIALNRDVKPGEEIILQWREGPFQQMGVNNTIWQMHRGDQPFPGEAIRIAVIVLPEELKKKQAELEEKVKEWIAQGLENIEELAIKWIEKELDNCLRSLGIPFFGIIIFKWIRRRKKARVGNKERAISRIMDKPYNSLSRKG